MKNKEEREALFRSKDIPAKKDSRTVKIYDFKVRFEIKKNVDLPLVNDIMTIGESMMSKSDLFDIMVDSNVTQEQISKLEDLLEEYIIGNFDLGQ